MNYIDSKFKLLPLLKESIESTLQQKKTKPLEDSIFCDLFVGTAAVEKLFNSKVRQIITNDKEYYSFILAQNYIGTTRLCRAPKSYSIP